MAPLFPSCNRARPAPKMAVPFSRQMSPDAHDVAPLTPDAHEDADDDDGQTRQSEPIEVDSSPSSRDTGGARAARSGCWWSREDSEELTEAAGSQQPEARAELWCKRTHWSCPKCAQDLVEDIIAPRQTLRDVRDLVHVADDPNHHPAMQPAPADTPRGPECMALLQHPDHRSCPMFAHSTVIMSLKDAKQTLGLFPRTAV